LGNSSAFWCHQAKLLPGKSANPAVLIKVAGCFLFLKKIVDCVHGMNKNELVTKGKSINRVVACQIIKEAMSNEEIEYNALKLLEANPQLSQRQLSTELDVSLGKTHYVLKSLIAVGWVKLDNFRRSDNKMGYAYVLTPAGIAEKAKITVRFLGRKQREYLELQSEIQDLQVEVEKIERGHTSAGKAHDKTD
jgi:EPS-associated MarR family transcriptional regulator